MEIGWIMAGFFVFVSMVFVAVALFLPEWVGITGKKAKDIMAEHQEESAPTGSLPSTQASPAQTSSLAVSSEKTDAPKSRR